MKLLPNRTVNMQLAEMEAMADEEAHLDEDDESDLEDYEDDDLYGDMPEHEQDEIRSAKLASLARASRAAERRGKSAVVLAEEDRALLVEEGRKGYIIGAPEQGRGGQSAGAVFDASGEALEELEKSFEEIKSGASGASSGSAEAAGTEITSESGKRFGASSNAHSRQPTAPSKSATTKAAPREKQDSDELFELPPEDAEDDLFREEEANLSGLDLSALRNPQQLRSLEVESSYSSVSFGRSSEDAAGSATTETSVNAVSKASESASKSSWSVSAPKVSPMFPRRTAPVNMRVGTLNFGAKNLGNKALEKKTATFKSRR